MTIPADFQQRRFVQIGEEPVRLEVLAERVRQAILPRDDKSLFIRMDAVDHGAGYLHASSTS